MGLDVYFYNVKNVRNSSDEQLMDIRTYNELNDAKYVERFRKFADDELAILKECDAVEYEKEYKSIFSEKMERFVKYAWYYEYMLNEVKPYEEVKKFFDDFVSKHDYAEEDVYFRKVNFVYHFFMDKLEDEQCFVSKSDLEDLIDRCERVLADHSLAEELLPTQSGFFFGSTDYDEWYFRDVKDAKNEFEKLLADYDEEHDVIFVCMSW